MQENHPFCYNHAAKKGLIYIYQLFENQQVISFRTAFEKYALSIMEFNTILTSIPAKWKLFFKTIPHSAYMPLEPYSYDRHLYVKNLTAKVYEKMVSQEYVFYDKIAKWENDLSCELNAKEFVTKVQGIHKVTNVTKFRSFQYRIMMRGETTNIQLKIWKIRENDLCSFCQNSRETETHLFVHCDYVRELWKMIAEYISDNYDICVDVEDVKKILFNEKVPIVGHVVNFVCLVTKQYVYQQRCLGKNLNFNELCGYIKELENIEKYIAVKNGNVQRHYKKWKPEKQCNPPRVVCTLQDYVRNYINNV